MASSIGRVFDHLSYLEKGYAMRMKILAAAGMGIALGSCGHSSKTETIRTSAITQPGTGGQPNLNGTFSVAASGIGLQSNGTASPSTITVGGKVTNSIITAKAPIAFRGDDPLKDSLETSNRRQKADSSIRFLMGDASANSKDAPTAFGIVQDKSTASAFQAGGYFGGAAPTNIPKAGTATYKGSFAGVGYAANGTTGSAGRLSGDFGMTADFGAGKVAGNISNIRADTQMSPSKPITPDSAVKFSATMDAARAGYASGPGDTANVNVKGGFFGSGANETAGAITSTKSDGTGMAGAFYGAKQ